MCMSKIGFDNWDSPINVEFDLQRTNNDQAILVHGVEQWIQIIESIAVSISQS